MAVDALETELTPGRRHRIEHLELACPEDAERLGNAGITASIRRVHSDRAIVHEWPNLVSYHRYRHTVLYKSLQDRGAVLSLGTDAPTAPYAPLPNLYNATTRRSAREPESKDTTTEDIAISLAEAMTAATEGAAYSSFADSCVGKLSPGMKADIVVVEMEWKPERLLEVRVCQTWGTKGGRSTIGMKIGDTALISLSSWIGIAKARVILSTTQLLDWSR